MDARNGYKAAGVVQTRAGSSSIGGENIEGRIVCGRRREKMLIYGMQLSIQRCQDGGGGFNGRDLQLRSSRCKIRPH